MLPEVHPLNRWHNRKSRPPVLRPVKRNDEVPSGSLEFRVTGDGNVPVFAIFPIGIAILLRRSHAVVPLTQDDNDKTSEGGRENVFA